MMKQAKVIAVVNHKGGVGKTTTVASVGTILARNHKVLLVDLDPQMNLTLSLVKDTGGESIYETLVGKRARMPILSVGNLDLVPSSLRLSMAEFEMVSMMAREQKLSRLLEPLREEYDYIFLDCPPSLGILTFNALAAADTIIIPLVPELLPLQGLGTIDSLVHKMQSVLNPRLTITGILLTRTEQTKIHCTLENKLRGQLGDLVFSTKIRKNIAVAEAPTNQKSIVDYDPSSNGAVDYTAFTSELEARLAV